MKLLASMSASPSSHAFSRFVWHLEDPEINSDTTKMEASYSFLDFPDISYKSISDPKPTSTGDPKAAKKLIHNANERHRRQRVNNTYSHLRSLLPGTHKRTKTMSIPATIMHVLKYIPELKQQVQGLIKEKEGLRIRMQGHGEIDRNREALVLVGGINITGSQIGNGGIMVQISTPGCNIYRILLILEQHGLFLLHASSFRPSCGMLLLNLHFKAVEGSRLMKCELLSIKLKSLLDETLVVLCC